MRLRALFLRLREGWRELRVGLQGFGTGKVGLRERALELRWGWWRLRGCFLGNKGVEQDNGAVSIGYLPKVSILGTAHDL